MDSLERINDLVRSKAFQELRKKTVLLVLKKQREREDCAFLQRMAAVLRSPLPGFKKQKRK